MTRIVPNKYPSLSGSVQVAAGGPYASLETDGRQEIVIPSPRCVASFAELTRNEASVAIQACQYRYRQLASISTIKHVMIFMNCGLEAGASIGHIHLQIMASPLISPYVERRAQLHQQYQARHGLSLLRALLDWETDQQVRVVEQTEHFTVLCPYASRHAFQTWILPRDDCRFPGARHATSVRGSAVGRDRRCAPVHAVVPLPMLRASVSQPLPTRQWHPKAPLPSRAK